MSPAVRKLFSTWGRPIGHSKRAPLCIFCLKPKDEPNPRCQVHPTRGGGG